MICFAVATLYFYRDDIVPAKEGETCEDFRRKNKRVLRRVFQEALNLHAYELSYEQMSRAIVAYTCRARAMKGTRPARLSAEVKRELEAELI